MGKSHTNKLKHRSWVIYILCAIAAGSYWPWLFYSTRTPTPDNSYQIRAEIDHVQVKEFLSGPQLYIYTTDTCYECNVRYTSVSGEKVAQATADRIEDLESPVTLTVIRLYSRHGLFAKRSELPVESRVIGLCTDTEVIWSVDKYRSSVRFTRTVGIIVGIPLSSALLLPLAIQCLLLRGKRQK